jgi:hypothetical protein
MNSPSRLRQLATGTPWIAIVLAVVGCNDRSADRAAAQVERIADELDAKTTAAGVYVRLKDGEVKELDPWRTPIRVTYSQGGIAEVIDVRSAGPDREFHTSDDISQVRMAANFKGLGEGIRKNVEETAASAAKGAVRGALQGARESLHDSLPPKWKEQLEEASPVDPPSRKFESTVGGPRSPREWIL